MNKSEPLKQLLIKTKFTSAMLTEKPQSEAGDYHFWSNAKLQDNSILSSFCFWDKISYAAPAGPELAI